MKWLEYFVKAQTQYNLHSPFLFSLYTDVLFSRLPKGSVVSEGRYEEFVWRVEHFYGGEVVREGWKSEIVGEERSFLVIDHPHRHEAEWMEIVRGERWNVTLDFYRVGIGIEDSRLSRQEYLLR